MNGESKSVSGTSLWINYIIATLGWLACAALCLVLTIKLEEFPNAYDTLFPVILLLLFGNIFVFLFIASRWSRNTKKLSLAVSLVCFSETLLVIGIYCLGRFLIAS